MADFVNQLNDDKLKDVTERVHLVDAAAQVVERTLLRNKMHRFSFVYISHKHFSMENRPEP